MGQFQTIKAFAEQHQKEYSEMTSISSFPCDCGAVKKYMKRLCDDCQAAEDFEKQDEKPRQ